MSGYLLIESRDPFESGCSHFHELAIDLIKEGKSVTLFLVQNGVLPARECRYTEQLTQAAAQGVKVMVDDFSIRERGIKPDHLGEGIEIAPLDTVIDQMAAGHKVMWH